MIAVSSSLPIEPGPQRITRYFLSLTAVTISASERGRDCAQGREIQLPTTLSAIAAEGSSATQRNPMCVVALSCDCGDRAAGRYRWQYSGAHRCEPPLSAWLTVGSASSIGGQHPCAGSSGRWCPANSRRRPLPHVADHVDKAVAVRRKRADRRRARPPQRAVVLIRELALPRIGHQLPARHRDRRPTHRWSVPPPRAAYSHSASLGSRRPAHRA